MDIIFHEKQEGALCAQHCLNALLQGQYYTAVELADIARQLDEAESAERHGDRPREEASANMDDTGFFSVQVIAKAISVWGLELVNYNSSDETAVSARDDPVSAMAFICNFREHWLTIRRLGSQWFNLNSLYTGPELISDTYLSLTLAQLQRDGYSIYLIMGVLPDCPAHQLLSVTPVVQAERPRLIGDQAGSGESAGGRPQAGQSGGGGSQEDEEFQRAMQLSMQGTSMASLSTSTAPVMMDSAQDDDEALQMAIQASLMGAGGGGGGGGVAAPNVAAIGGAQDDDEELRMALAMSMDCAGDPPESSTEAASAKKSPVPTKTPQSIASKSSATHAAAPTTPPSASATVHPQRSPVAPAQTAARTATSQRPSATVNASSATSRPQKTSTSTAGTSAPPPRSSATAAATTAGFLSRPPGTYGAAPSSSMSSAGGHRLDGGRPMSAATAAARATPDPEEVRNRRMAFLDKLQKSPPKPDDQG